MSDLVHSVIPTETQGGGELSLWNMNYPHPLMLSAFGIRFDLVLCSCWIELLSALLLKPPSHITASLKTSDSGNRNYGQLMLGIHEIIDSTGTNN
jgi:hypothetical protein